MQLIKAANDPKLLPLGAAVPHAQFMPVQAVAAAMARTLRQHGAAAAAYAFPPGHLNLRRQIAKRMTELACPTDPDGIVITNGCQEAIGLALRALTKPGDVVAIESPTFYGLLQVIEVLGLKALEIPTHPREGMSIEALEFALQQWPVRVCIVTPNFSNPLGSCMSTERKRDLVNLLEQRNIPLIEDDVYGDLGFEGARPSITKALDPSGNTVIYCSSFSKTLTPGLRVGWIAAGRYQAEIEYHKYVLNLASPTASQMAVAELLERGGYDRYLRQARRDYATAVGAHESRRRVVFSGGHSRDAAAGRFRHLDRISGGDRWQCAVSASLTTRHQYRTGHDVLRHRPLSQFYSVKLCCAVGHAHRKIDCAFRSTSIGNVVKISSLIHAR